MLAVAVVVEEERDISMRVDVELDVGHSWFQDTSVKRIWINEGNQRQGKDRTETRKEFDLLSLVSNGDSLN